MIERFASKDVYNKMTDDDFDMVVDEFEYILNTTMMILLNDGRSC